MLTVFQLHNILQISEEEKKTGLKQKCVKRSMQFGTQIKDGENRT